MTFFFARGNLFYITCNRSGRDGPVWCQIKIPFATERIVLDGIRGRESCISMGRVVFHLQADFSPRASQDRASDRAACIFVRSIPAITAVGPLAAPNAPLDRCLNRPPAAFYGDLAGVQNQRATISFFSNSVRFHQSVRSGGSREPVGCLLRAECRGGGGQRIFTQFQ